MTYEDAIEIADAVFDEYLPKVGPRARKRFLDALFGEFTHIGVMEIESEVTPDDSDVFEDEDD